MALEAWHSLQLESPDITQSTSDLTVSQDFTASSQRVADLRDQEEEDRKTEWNVDDILLGIDGSDESLDGNSAATSSESHKGTSIDKLPIPQQIEAIDTEIAEIQTKLEEFAQMEALETSDRRERSRLRRRLAELENQQSQLIEQQIAEENQEQAAQAEAIKNYDEALANFAEIRSYLPGGMSGVSGELQEILARGDALLATDEYQGGDAESILSEQIEKITKQAVTYLAQPHHRVELVNISREMQTQNPAQYEGFKRFLIQHEPAFWEIFHDIENDIDNSHEASVSAALPSLPSSGTMNEGFHVDLPDGSNVAVSIDGNDIRRELDMQGANFPLASEVQDIDLSDSEASRDAALNEFGPLKQQAERALQVIRQNLDADFSELKAQLRQTLGTEMYQELGIDAFTDANAASRNLEEHITTYQEQIDEAFTQFRQEAQAAIQAAREAYERQDEEMKITLKAIRNSGLGRLGLDWIMRELLSGQLIPDIGTPFDTGNFDPAAGNFWELSGVSDNASMHLQYIYRMANKLISSNPEEPFSLTPNLLRNGNPQPIASSQSAVAIILTNAGLIGGAGMVDKELVRERLGAPIQNADSIKEDT